LRRRKYFQGRAIRGGGVKDVAWLAPDGREMTDEAWNADSIKSLGMLLSGAIEEVNERGEPIVGDTLLALLNAHDEDIAFRLPALETHHQWQQVADTFDPEPSGNAVGTSGSYLLRGRSIVVLKLVGPLRERRRASDVERASEAAGTAKQAELIAIER
jgi:glycogen operon protein